MCFNKTKESKLLIAKRLDENAGLGCAIWGLILIFSIIGSLILTYIINN